jgi:hypothetical protein
MPDLFVPSSTGVVLTPDQVSPGQNGTNLFTDYVSRPVPGQILQTHGVGQFSVDHVGHRGSLTAEVITGVAGAARALVKLTSDLISPPRDTIQLSLDTQNRPVLTIAYAGASIITFTTPGGPALPAGALVQVRVVWDSMMPLPSGRHVDFNLLSGAAVPGTMGSIPAVPWDTLPMFYVRVGYGALLSDFNGTFLSIQVGEQRM